MPWIILFVYLIPTLFEAFQDRNGETKKDKRKDLLWLVVAGAVIVWLAWLVLDKSPVRSAFMIIGWRVLVFDYLVQYILIKNKVIVGHWFTYTGKTARWDRIISRVHPVARFVIRLSVFALAVLYYYTQ